MPEDPQNGTGHADLIASLIILELFAGVLVRDQLRGWTASADEPLSILNPGLPPAAPTARTTAER